jgi:DNA-binding CsgD family transcriptional regulator
MDMLSGRDSTGTGLGPDVRSGLDWGFSTLMDELAYGMLVTRLDGHILHLNQAARHELGRTHLLSVSHNLLQARRQDHSKTLNAAIARAAQGKRSMITLADPDSDGLTLAVLPLRSDATLPASRAALLFQRPSVCESLMLCFFARSHGLTNTEEQVLGILCHGYSAPQVAAQMKLAVSTVRSHVRSLCSKTRSNGVRQLVNRVAMLPPVAPALRYEQMH